MPFASGTHALANDLDSLSGTHALASYVPRLCQRKQAVTRSFVCVAVWFIGAIDRAAQAPFVSQEILGDENAVVMFEAVPDDELSYAAIELQVVSDSAISDKHVVSRVAKRLQELGLDVEEIDEQHKVQIDHGHELEMVGKLPCPCRQKKQPAHCLRRWELLSQYAIRQLAFPLSLGTRSILRGPVQIVRRGP